MWKPMNPFIRTLRTEAVISAPIGLVWSVLTETASYEAWNPFLPRVIGRVETGRNLRLTIAPPGARVQDYSVRVTALVSEREFAWLGRFHLPGLMDGHHTLRLADLGGGRTRLDHQETFRGLLVPMLWGYFLSTKLRDGFLVMNAACAARCQALVRDGRQPCMQG